MADAGQGGRIVRYRLTRPGHTLPYGEDSMRPAIVNRASAGFVACATAIAVAVAVAVASPTLADPSDQIPGNGVFTLEPGEEKCGAIRFTIK